MVRKYPIWSLVYESYLAKLRFNLKTNLTRKDTMEDIAQMYKDFRQGKFPHLNDLPSIQKISYSSQISN